MKGFELEINGEKIFGSTENGMTLIIADVLRDEAKLTFQGNSFNEDKSVKERTEWFDSELKEGQEFTVRVKKIEKDR